MFKWELTVYFGLNGWNCWIGWISWMVQLFEMVEMVEMVVIFCKVFLHWKAWWFVSYIVYFGSLYPNGTNSGISMLIHWFTVSFEQSDSFHMHSMTGRQSPAARLTQICDSVGKNVIIILWLFYQKIIWTFNTEIPLINSTMLTSYTVT